jgi:hypothetical protein
MTIFPLPVVVVFDPAPKNILNPPLVIVDPEFEPINMLLVPLLITDPAAAPSNKLELPLVIAFPVETLPILILFPPNINCELTDGLPARVYVRLGEPANAPLSLYWNSLLFPPGLANPAEP